MITKNLKKELEVRVRLAGYKLVRDKGYSHDNFSEVCNFGECKKKGVRYYYFPVEWARQECFLTMSCEDHFKAHEAKGWHEL